MPIWPPQNTGYFEIPPCIVCCGSPPDLYCRIRGNEAELCGWSEYDSPSTPPKKYHVQQCDMDFIFCFNYAGSPCTGNASTNRNLMIGALSTFGTDTCEIVTTDNDRSIYAGSGTACPNPSLSLVGTDHPLTSEIDIATDGATIFAFGFDIITLTQTFIRYETNGDCYDPGTPGQGHIESGYIEFEISGEDTVDDAIARFQADIAWDDWQLVGRCEPVECCLAFWGERPDTGFTFPYQEAQWKITQGGLTASTLYNVTVDIWRREYGTSDVWELYQTIADSATTDAGGNLEVEGDVPNDLGYESYASNPTVALP